MDIQSISGYRTPLSTQRDKLFLQAVLEILAENHSGAIDAEDRIQKLVAEHFNSTSKQMYRKSSLNINMIASLKRLLFRRFKRHNLPN